MRGDDVVGAQHVLVEQIADREVVGMVADRHHRDDLLAVEKQRQRPLDHDRGLDRLARPGRCRATRRVSRGSSGSGRTVNSFMQGDHGAAAPGRRKAGRAVRAVANRHD